MSILVLFDFFKHSVNHKRNLRTRIILYQAIIFYSSIGNIGEEEVCVIFVKEWFCCKTRQDLLINCDAIESLCLKIVYEK